MPIYEYECRRCHHRFELIQRFSDKPRKRCPECKSAVDRLISAPAIRFKGTGWYVTDYANKGNGKSDESARGAEAAESAEADAKADAKAGTKKDSKEEAKRPAAKTEKKAS